MRRINQRSCGVRTGYTLIELLIVIVLLGTAGAILIPHLTGLNKLEVQAAVRTIISDLSFAQSDALANQEFRRVHFYPDGSGYCLIRVTSADFTKIFDYSDGAPVADAPEYIIDPLGGSGLLERYVVNFETDDRFKFVKIESATLEGVVMNPNGTDITYDALGGSVSSPSVPGIGGTIVIASEDQKYQITIAPFTGKISVLKLP
ncbi:MAG: prepilin-type N-terminal cleavage/methylation domain-containing protein [Planctomycetota bacterium]|nr:prepilin-type N-terminal cleavage/methylation domain-containing protein [Planctomycetota bacterium]